MIKVIALDIGGVLAYQDYSKLSNHEKFLLQIYLDKDYSKFRLQKEKRELILETEEKIEEIYSKLYVLMNESMDLLEFIRREGYLPSIWTNNRTAINGWLHNTGIKNYIRPGHLCNSCNMPNGVNKPDKRFYQYALKQLQILPQQVLFVDDKIENIIGAKELGIHGLWHLNHSNLTESIKDKIKIVERKHL